MLSRARRRLSFANVCSALALFVALSTGGAYAAHLTVFSSDIVDGEVKNADLGPDAVTTNKILNGNVALGDMATNSVSGVKVFDNSLTGSDVKESTLGTVPNADKVNGYPASGIARVGGNGNAATGSFFTFSDLTSVTISAPTNGHVLVTGSAYGTADDADCAPCYLHLVIRDATTGDESAVMFESVASGEYGTLSGTWVFPVQAGQRTFTLRGAAAGSFGSPESVGFRNSEITALFTPFGSAPDAQPSRATRGDGAQRRRDGSVRRR